MSPSHDPPTYERTERALASLIADAGAAVQQLDAVLGDAATAPAARAFAHAVRAVIELREGQTAVGLQHLAAGEALADGSPPFARAADMLQHGRAQWHRREQRQAQAEALLQALHARAAQRPPADACLSAASLGAVLSMRGRDEDAIGLYHEALEYARRSGVASLLANALNNLGTCLLDLYDAEGAVPLLRDSLDGAQRVGSRRQVIYAAGNLVLALCQCGQPAQALAVAREHLIGSIRADDPPALQRSEEIALALLDNGRVDEALAALGEQAQVDPLSNDTVTLHVALLARVLLSRGDAPRALQACLARRTLLASDDDRGTQVPDRVMLLRTGAQAAHRCGEHRLAWELLEETFALHEQMLARSARARQIGLQVSERLRQAEWERDAAQRMAQRLEALNARLQAQMSENERLQQQLRAAALEDPLTGAYNRRHLMEAGAALLKMMRRRGDTLAVCLVDLDHFKQVNDRHGHGVGDRVLRGFVTLARSSLRAEDMVCRYGGEEFVLLMPGARAAQAADRIETLLAQFAMQSFGSSAQAPLHCSFSAGVCDSAGPPATLETLLTRADAALYTAKAQGRARVQCAQEPLSAAPSPAS